MTMTILLSLHRRSWLVLGCLLPSTSVDGAFATGTSTQTPTSQLTGTSTSAGGLLPSSGVDVSIPPSSPERTSTGAECDSEAAPNAIPRGRRVRSGGGRGSGGRGGRGGPYAPPDGFFPLRGPPDERAGRFLLGPSATPHFSLRPLMRQMIYHDSRDEQGE